MLLHWSFAMAISKELLEILVCPICKAVVELKPDNSGLKCVECRRVYPIRDEIPVMRLTTAAAIPASTALASGDDSISTIGFDPGACS